MPCECGPDVRSLWEQVRDFQRHHDEVAEENAKLRRENEKLQRKLSALQEAIRPARTAGRSNR